MEPIPNPERLLADTLWLQSVARQLTRDPDAAEDLAQDTWLSALCYRGKAILNHRAWLRVALSRLAASEGRARVARSERERDVARSETLPSTAELCERAELQRVLGQALLELDEPLRTTALLRFLEGLAPVEIAERLSLPANTVRWRLRRSVEELRERLDRDIGKHWSRALLALSGSGEMARTSSTLGTATALGTALMIKKSLLVCAVIVVAALLVTFARQDPGTPSPSEAGSSPSAEWVANEPAAATTPVGEARESIPELEATSPAVESKELTTGTLLFEAVAREDGRPLAGVAAMPEVNGTALVDYESSKELLSDERGELRCEVPAHQPIHVQAWGEGEPAGLAVLDVPPLEVGEVRRVRLELPTAIDRHFFARLVDEESKSPIAEARIVAKRPTGFDGVIEEAETDFEGVFELRVPSWRTAYFNASLPGYGRIAFAAADGHASRERALELTLPRAATLEGRVELAGQRPAGLRVALEASGWDVQRPRPEQSIFFLPEVWTAEVREDGRYRLEGLNAGARYEAKLLAEGRAVREAPETVVLESGETRVLDWRLGFGTKLRGELVDQEDLSVADAEIWLVATRWDDARRFYGYDSNEAAKVRTDATGRFQFDDVEPGKWLIGPGASPTSRLAPWAIVIDIEADQASRQVALKTWRNLALRGTVVDPAGAPVLGISVTVDASDGGRRSVSSDENGRFEVLGLREVEYTLTAGGMDKGHARSEPVTLRPGEEEPTLRLAPGGAIRGRVLGTVGITNTGMAIVSARHPANEDDDWMRVAVRVDGYFSIDGLAPGLYDVYVERNDGRYAIASGHRVEVGIPSKELRMELAEGARLTPRVAEGVEWAAYDLYVGEAFISFGSCAPDRFGAHIVPPGIVEIRYRTKAGVERSILVEAKVGVPTAVELR